MDFFASPNFFTKLARTFLYFLYSHIKHDTVITPFIPRIDYNEVMPYSLLHFSSAKINNKRIQKSEESRDSN